MSVNGKYSDRNNVNEAYWRELGVRFDALNEMLSEQKYAHFKLILEVLSSEELLELASMVGIALTDNENREQMQKDMLSVSKDELELLIFLRDFQNRRKKAIGKYYESNSDSKKFSTSLAQLRHLFAQSPSHLFSVYTFHLWDVRGSGEVFSLEKGISKKLARQIATEHGFGTTLQDKLFKASGEKNKYRNFSFSIIGDCRYIVLLYKQVNDTSIPDFKEAVRNQEVSTLLFEFDTENKTLEIKSAAHFEVQAIREYANITFNAEFIPVKAKVYKDYDKTTFIETVLHGKTASGKHVEDFLVEKVVFRGSPLKNSPEVTLQLKNIDIWPSVIDAHEHGSLDVRSIKDLASLSFKAAGTSRTIRSIVKENGNVFFTMDDSRLDRDKLEMIKDKFAQKFGIPLYQEISNEKFNDGKADLIDYVMAQSDPSKHRDPEVIELHERLVVEKLLDVKTDRMAVCKGGLHSIKLDEGEEFPKECVSCETEMRVDAVKTVEINMNNVKKRVKKLAGAWCDSGEWALLPDAELTHGGVKNKMIKLEHLSDNKTLQILVTDRSLHATLLNKLGKMLTPTIIVVAGQQAKFVEKHSQDCVQVVTFGKIHVLGDHEVGRFFDALFSSLELRAKSYVAAAANKAYNSIVRTFCDPADVEKSYGASDLEDDAYAILKDIFPNAVKWGKEQSGKSVPEGVFSISYTLQKGNTPKQTNLAFSYDCKFTRDNDGYPLGIEEQRKAADYVRLLNDSDLIPHYASKSQLSAHIFIYNHFSEAKIEGMKKYFEEHLQEDYMTVPIFLKTDMLAYLHLKYLEHHEEVANSRNYFLSWLCEIFLNKEGIVTKEQIDRVFEKLLSKQSWEVEVINMPKLTQEVTKKNVI